MTLLNSLLRFTFIAILITTFLQNLNAQPESESEEPTRESLAGTNSKFLIQSMTDATSEKYFEYLGDNLNTEDGFVALQRITEKFIKEKDWTSAIGLYEEYKPDFPKFKDKIDKIIAILKKPGDDLVEVNLGPNINSKAQEYSPLPSADKSRLYFTGMGRDFLNDTEDVFYSDFRDSTWQPAKRLPAPVNTINQEAPQSISTDGNQLILFGNFKGSMGKGDLFFTERIKDTVKQWSEVKPYPEPINSIFFDCDAKLSADGRFLIFVSDRPGGIGETHPYNTPFHGSLQGNTDIYISKKNPDGTWGKPINLGSKINTPFAERKPFLHPDGRTLYFASEGHPGIGRLDLFKASRLNDVDWDKWSEPINLGKEINTTSDDRGAIVSTEGELAYFAASGRTSSIEGSSDIFTMKLPEFARPNKVAMISGVVTDNKGKNLVTDIVWEDLESGVQLGELKSSPIDGKYFFVLPLGRNYGFYAKRKGYFPISKNIDLRKEKNTLKLEDQNIVMVSIADLIGDDLEMTGNSDMMYDQFSMSGKKKITMNNLFFDYNKWNLLKASFPELDRIVWLLENYPIELVEIGGFTDSVGKDEYNVQLSEKRANSVMEYLVKKGVKKELLTAKGYGKLYPVATNETDEGRQKNRRVELRILKINKLKADEMLKDLKKDDE